MNHLPPSFSKKIMLGSLQILSKTSRRYLQVHHLHQLQRNCGKFTVNYNSGNFATAVNNTSGNSVAGFNSTGGK
jgi:hypothetical protein